MPCKYCYTDFVTYGLIISSGAKVVVCRCPDCGKDQNPKQRFLPKTAYDWEKLPLWDNFSVTAAPCCVLGCMAKGTEYHHFSPIHLFGEDADLWPTGFLCKDHHYEWHEKTKTGYFAKRTKA